MATNYLVRVAATAAASDGGTHDTTCRCTCGWSVQLSAPTPALAIQVAAKARSNHLEDAHPGQATQAGAVVHAHSLLIGGSVKRDHWWTRHAVCSCGWDLAVTERSPDRVAALIRTQHRDHLMHETGRAPLRDYVVLAALLVVITVLMVAMASAAIRAGIG